LFVLNKSGVKQSFIKILISFKTIFYLLFYMDLLKIPGRDILVSLIHATNELIPGPELTSQQKKSSKIIAHRGAVSKKNPENTIASFQKAIELGVDGIELDLHLTADEHVVIQHDQNLRRIFGSHHIINDLSLAQLKEKAPELPTLDELLKYAPPQLLLFLEIKRQTSPAVDKILAVQLMRQLARVDHPVFFITLHPDLLLEFPVSAHYKRIPIFPRFAEPQIQWVLEKKMDGIFGYYWFFSADLVNLARSANLITGCGIINGINLAKRFIARGFDILFTDRADLLIPLVKGEGKG
jgi:glycerophosphoryl diester phosphodiesterase